MCLLPRPPALRGLILVGVGAALRCCWPGKRLQQERSAEARACCLIQKPFVKFPCAARSGSWLRDQHDSALSFIPVW